MQLPGLRNVPRRGGKLVEYALVILTVTIIIVLATWILGTEIAAGLAQTVNRPVAPAGP